MSTATMTQDELEYAHRTNREVPQFQAVIRTKDAAHYESLAIPGQVFTKEPIHTNNQRLIAAALGDGLLSVTLAWPLGENPPGTPPADKKAAKESAK